VIKFTSTHEIFISAFGLMESKVKDARVEGSNNIIRLRTRGLSLEVWLEQGLKDTNPRGERLTLV
jgi:hypothetical protein